MRLELNKEPFLRRKDQEEESQQLLLEGKPERKGIAQRFLAPEIEVYADDAATEEAATATERVAETGVYYARADMNPETEVRDSSKKPCLWLAP